jgi:CheY-like chemotaxis protein
VTVKRVLIVEDDVDLRRLFKTALGFSGYSVLEAGDGLEALRLLDADRVDLVVLDLGLPVISGHTVLEEVATRADRHEVPVIVVTGTAGPHRLPHARAILSKPITPERLLGAVHRSIGLGPSVLGA